MNSRDDVLKRLRNDSTYKRALAMAKDDVERRRIIAVSEGVVVQLLDAILPMSNAIRHDPEALQRLQQAMNSIGKVVNERDGSVVSGSI